MTLISANSNIQHFIISQLQDFPPFNTSSYHSLKTPLLATSSHHTVPLLSAWIPCGSNSPHFPHSSAPNTTPLRRLTGYLYIGSLRHPKLLTKLFPNLFLLKGRLLNTKEALRPLFLQQVDQLSKGLQSVSHELALVQAKIQVLRDANTALSKRWRVKRTQLQDGEVLTGS